MRQYLFLVPFALLLTVAGCNSSTEPAPVATDEDEIAAYEAMIAEDQEATEADSEDVAP